MNILLTGGAGYIGSHACLSLLDAGFNVTVLDDLSTGHEQLIPFGVEFIKTNINDTKTLDILFKKKGIIQGLYADVGLSFFEQFAVLLPSDTRFYDS